MVTLLLSVVGLAAVAWHGATEASQPLPNTAREPISAAAPPPTARLDPLAQQESDVFPCTSPAPPTPTPFNGATEESAAPGENPTPGRPAEIAHLTSGGDAQDKDVCVGAAGPAPVIAEAPLPVLLPLTAAGVLAGAWWLARRPQHVIDSSPYQKETR